MGVSREEEEKAEGEGEERVAAVDGVGVKPRPRNYTMTLCAIGHATQSKVTGVTNPRPKPLAGVLGMDHRQRNTSIMP